MRYALSKDDLHRAFQASFPGSHRGDAAAAADAFLWAMADEFCSVWPVYSHVGSQIGHAAARVDDDVPEMAQVTDFALAATRSLVGAIVDSYGNRLEELTLEKLKDLSKSLIAMLDEVFRDGKPDAACMKVYAACCRCSSLTHSFSAGRADDWVKSPVASDMRCWKVVLDEAKQACARRGADADAPASTEATLTKLVEAGFLVNNTLLSTLSQLLANLPGDTPLNVFNDVARYADTGGHVASDSSEYRLRHYAEAQRILDNVLPREVCANERV